MINRYQMEDLMKKYLYDLCRPSLSTMSRQDLEGILSSWAECFKYFSIDDLEPAFKDLMMTYTGEGLPKPGDLVKVLASRVKRRLPNFDYVYRIVDRCSFTKEAFDKFPKFVKYIIVGPSNLKVWANTDYNFWVTEGKQNYERFTSIENISMMILDGKMEELKEMYAE